MKLVREVMSTEVFTVPVDAGIREISRIMRKNDVDGVAVEEHGQHGPIGVITDLDVVRHIGEEDVKAVDIMTEAPSRIKPDSDLYEAAQMMADEGVHRLFVMPKPRVFECATLGIITAADILNAIAEGD